MSERLMNGLASTKQELEAGVADAEAELERAQDYCRRLEEIIGVGKATLHAAGQMQMQKLTRPDLGANNASTGRVRSTS